MSRPLIIHFLMLLGLLAGAGALILSVPNMTTHWIIIAGIGATYLVWAVWHHHDARTLSKDALLEYLCIIAIISLVLLLL
jgi:hypothetical protein